MKSILIIKNVSHEGPGLIEEVLKERDVPFEVRELDRGETFPSPEQYSAVIVMGGPDSANDQTPKMKQEITRVQEILKKKIPYLGICLGMQVLVKPAGGKVMKSPYKEVGFRHYDGSFYKVYTTQKDVLFEGVESPISVFQLHGETVELLPGIELLGRGNHIPNQIVKAGEKAYGLQCHIEITPALLENWIKTDPDLQSLDEEALRHDWEVVRGEYLRTGKKLIQNFLLIAGCLK